MQWLSPALLAIQVISALAIIVLVLLQQGKGSEMGAAFGSGSAGSLFGASGAANFLSRTTKWAAIVFFATTGGLAYIAHHPSASTAVDSGIMQGFKSAPATESTPAPTPKASETAVPSVPDVPTSGTPAVPGSTASSSAGPGSTGSSPTAPADRQIDAAGKSVSVRVIIGGR